MKAEAVELGLAKIRQEMEQLREAFSSVQLPTVLTMKRAAHELSRSLTTVKLMIKRHELLTVMIGNTRMVPASEIRRLASIDAKRMEKPKPPRSSLQDPEALKRRR